MNLKYKNARILIVDDDEDDFIITSDFIRSISVNLFSIDWCSNYNEGIKKYNSNIVNEMKDSSRPKSSK